MSQDSPSTWWGFSSAVTPNSAASTGIWSSRASLSCMIFAATWSRSLYFIFFFPRSNFTKWNSRSLFKIYTYIYSPAENIRESEMYFGDPMNDINTLNRLKFWMFVFGKRTWRAYVCQGPTTGNHPAAGKPRTAFSIFEVFIQRNENRIMIMLMKKFWKLNENNAKFSQMILQRKIFTNNLKLQFHFTVSECTLHSLLLHLRILSLLRRTWQWSKKFS